MIHCHDNVSLVAHIQIVIVNSRLQARNNEKPIRTKTISKETGTRVGAFSLLITEDILSQIFVNTNINVNICNVDIYQIPPTTLSLSVCLSFSVFLPLFLPPFLPLSLCIYRKWAISLIFLIYREGCWRCMINMDIISSSTLLASEPFWDCFISEQDWK